MSAGREQNICLQYVRFHKRCISLSPACLLQESGHLLFLLRRRVSAKKKSDILQIRRTTTKRNDFSCHACVSNQRSSGSESKLTEWCHNASPRALPGCLASRSLSRLLSSGALIQFALILEHSIVGAGAEATCTFGGMRALVF